MDRKFLSGFPFLLAILILLPTQALSVQKNPVKEDTAHLSLEKTAGAKGKPRNYQVKKGDSISKIIQSQMRSFSDRYTLLKKLNPRLKNLDRIYPGQILILPPENLPEAAGSPSPAGSKYTTRKGDTLTGIIIRQFKGKNAADILKLTHRIAQLNPKIKNPDRIYPGQILILPGKEEEEKPAETAEAVTAGMSDMAAADAAPPAAGAVTEEEKPVALQETRLTVISQVIKQMNGNVISTGNYFIPIPQAGRVAIDCAAIPIAELNDGSMILLDFAGRLPDSLRKVIQDNWKNYSLVRPSLRDDTATTLQKIINASREYTMAKWGKPLVIGNNPRIQLSPDWMITRKTPPGGSSYRQGIFFLHNTSQLLPRPFINYAGKNGLAITEIMEKTGIVSRQEEPGKAADTPVISGAFPLDTVFNLLTLLGYQAAWDTEVNIFDTAKDGFTLSIKAGLLVKSGDQRILFHPKTLPQQFIDILRKGKTEVIIIADNDPALSAIEKTLQAMSIPFSQNTFSFPLSGTNKPSAAITFPALKADREAGTLYLINFEVDRDIREFLRSQWGINIVRY